MEGTGWGMAVGVVEGSTWSSDVTRSEHIAFSVDPSLGVTDQALCKTGENKKNNTVISLSASSYSIHKN